MATGVVERFGLELARTDTVEIDPVAAACAVVMVVAKPVAVLDCVTPRRPRRRVPPSAGAPVAKARPGVGLEPPRDPADQMLLVAAAARRCGGSGIACAGCAPARRRRRRTAALAARPSSARAPRVPWRGSISCTESVSPHGWDGLTARQPVARVRHAEPHLAGKLKATFVAGQRFLSSTDRGRFRAPGRFILVWYIET